jgi:hypothetical protein
VTYVPPDPQGPPFKEDFFERAIDVAWGGEAFCFAGNVSLLKAAPPIPEVSPPDNFQVSWLGGTSKNGEDWKSAKPTLSGLALYCCVRGKTKEGSVTVAAGGVSVTNWAGPGYERAFGSEPAAGVSYDDGQIWSNGGIPLQQFILKPPNPGTGEAGHAATGNCNAVAYHPASKMFYVGGSVFFDVGSDIYWEDRLFSSMTGTGFGQVYSVRREISVPFKGYRWPEVEPPPGEAIIKPADRLRVADLTKTTKPGPGVRFVVSFGPGQRAEYFDTKRQKTYLAVNEGNIILGGKLLSPPMPRVNSVCGGVEHIVAVGWKDEARRVGPVTYVSADDGKSWQQQLSSLSHTNPGPDSDDSGSSSGSCSFS